MSLNRRMSDKHEEHLVEVFGGRRTAGSGNQPANPMDGRQNRYEESMAFAWDGKSSRGESIGVSRKMIEKAKQQALSERPMLSLRWYFDDRLTQYEDWHLIQEDDLLELLERSERLARLEVAIHRLADGEVVQEVFPDEMFYDGVIHALTSGLRTLLR